MGLALTERGFSPQHAKMLFHKTYRLLDPDPLVGCNLPKGLKQAFPDAFDAPPLAVSRSFQSRYDGSVKFALSLSDQSEVEMVLIPETSRITLCVSSQVGCKQGCTFCHTGRMGLKRNLDGAEIVGQVYLANKWISEHPEWMPAAGTRSQPRVSNIVFMGMGEPLDNVENVHRAIQILTNPRGFNIGLRKISVSTAGHLDGLNQLLSLCPNVPIAISLHNPFDAERSKLMPINRKWNVAQVVGAIAKINQSTKRHVLVQYTVIRNVNDSIAHAAELAKLLSGLLVKVNLIPLNEIEPSRYQAPLAEQLQSFRNVLYKAGLRTMVRYSKGQDIQGACGQLIRPLMHS